MDAWRPKQGCCYVIASLPRTGSYLLCEGLDATGIAGHPTEPFCPDYRDEFCRRWQLRADINFHDFFREVVKRGATPNGIIGVKVHWHEVYGLARDSGVSHTKVLPHLFPGAKYVHIFRRDLRAQAISYFRALATHEWWRIEGVRNDQIAGPQPGFSSLAIRQLEAKLASEQRAWHDFFEVNQLPRLTVCYEELSRGYRSELSRVLAFLGLNSAVADHVPEPRLVRQSDSTTDVWQRWMDEEDRNS